MPAVGRRQERQGMTQIMPGMLSVRDRLLLKLTALGGGLFFVVLTES